MIRTTVLAALMSVGFATSAFANSAPVVFSNDQSTAADAKTRACTQCNGKRHICLCK